MNLFKPSVNLLQQKSKNVISVFTKTVDDLTAVNASIEVEQSDRDAQIKKLEAENSTLQQLQKENQKIINKINDILS